MSDPKNDKFNLKAMINKEKSKVLFVEAGGDFVDVLLSFLTMPLGKVVKVLDKHFGVVSPSIGSLTTLYNGFMNLHSDNFWTEGCKQMLLNPASSFEAECRRLKLDITNTQLPIGFFCEKCSISKGCVSMLYTAASCGNCGGKMKKALRVSGGVGGVFTQHMAPFIISDALHVIPEAEELMQTITILGITDISGAELMNVTFGINEIMGVLKASMICSPTPLSDIILAQKREMIMIPPSIVKSKDGYRMEVDANSDTKKMSLKVIVQKSSNKILYGQAGEDFVDFLASFLVIPLGGTAAFLSSENYFKSINNLYRSVANVIDCKFFKTADMKNRFSSMKLAHGSIAENHILPLTEEGLPVWGAPTYSSDIFPEGQGKYLKGLRTYMVADDLTVTPFSISSTISMLNKLNIPLSDIKQVELQIGLQEALSILRASLSSTRVLTDALRINSISEKQPKQESV